MKPPPGEQGEARGLGSRAWMPVLLQRPRDTATTTDPLSLPNPGKLLSLPLHSRREAIVGVYHASEGCKGRVF